MELGRRRPTTWTHVERYRLRAVTIPAVELVLPFDYRYRSKYDQRSEGACVGFACSWMQSINNRRYFDASWLYHRAQEVDEWSGTDYSGTSVRAGFDVLRTEGHKRSWLGRTFFPNPAEGISANRWGTSVDEVRSAIALHCPVVFGVDWWSDFDQPEQVGGEWWIGRGDLGSIRGGHAIACYGASDRRQAFKLVNSWGLGYPTVWCPYETVEHLLTADGEAGITTDR